jgi:galactokinase
MNASHRSLRDDFEVSSDALNTMVDIATAHHACLGARMTGAGFGGCAVALVHSTEVNCFTEEVAAAYRERTRLDPAVYICQATRGAEVV